MKNIAVLVFMLTLMPAGNPVNAQQGSGPTGGANSSRAISEKEAAFKEYYKKDPACDSFKDDNMMDRCRFAYLTAKQEFEKIWAEKNTKK